VGFAGPYHCPRPVRAAIREEGNTVTNTTHTKTTRLITASEAFKAKFHFVKSGEEPRAMAADKDAIQAEVMPFIIVAVGQALAECQWNMSNDQAEEFVHVLTSPELHEAAA
jgi:hypothetical protein